MSNPSIGPRVSRAASLPSVEPPDDVEAIKKQRAGMQRGKTQGALPELSRPKPVKLKKGGARLVFGGDFRLSAEERRKKALEDRKVSWSLFLIPLLTIGCWLLLPLQHAPCDDPDLQDARVQLYVFRPIYVFISLVFGLLLFNIMLPAPPKPLIAFILVSGVLIDMCLSTWLVAHIDSSEDSGRERLRIWLYLSVIASAVPMMTLEIGYVLFNNKCVKFGERNAIMSSTHDEQHFQLEDDVIPDDDAARVEMESVVANVTVVDVRPRPQEQRADDAQDNQGAPEEDDADVDEDAVFRHDVQQLIITVEVVLVIILSYLACSVFSAYFQDTDEENIRVVMSFFFMIVLIPVLEKLMKLVLSQHNTDPIRGLVLHVAMKFVLDLFYFVYYRNLLVTRFTLISSFVVVELQSTLLEGIRYPLRITRWYMKREARLAEFLGDSKTAVVVGVGALLVVGFNLIVLIDDNGSVPVWRSALAYLGSACGAATIRVGLNFSHHPPALPDVLQESEVADEDFLLAELDTAVGAALPSRLSVEDDMALYNSVADETASYAHILHAVTSHGSIRGRSVSTKTVAARPGIASLAKGARSASQATDVLPKPQEPPETAQRRLKRFRTAVRFRGLQMLKQKQEAKLRDFQRVHATEHFIRKRARQLAMFSYLLFIPLLHEGYNSRFWPFTSDDGFGNDAMSLLWKFGIIMIVLDLTEATISRIVFNKTIGMDTFADAIGLIKPWAVRLAMFAAGTHILSDVFMATNKYRFCQTIL